MTIKKKVTAASIVRRCFNMKRIPSDDSILRQVYKSCPGSKFDENMLSWYKSRARTGQLSGVKRLDIKDGRKS